MQFIYQSIFHTHKIPVSQIKNLIVNFGLFINEKRYLIPISLPPEALASPIIANLQGEYQHIMDEFKEAHKQYQKSTKENLQLRELRNDIEIIDMEKENGKFCCEIPSRQIF